MDDAPGRGSPLPRLTVAIALAALLGGGVGFGVWTLSRDDDGPTRAASASSSPSTPPPSVSAAGPQDDVNSGPPTPKQSATDSDADTTPGYARSDDPAGFTVDVPSGWKRTAKTPTDKPTVVTYDSPDGSRILQLFLVSEGSPAESMDLAENENYGFARLPGYRALDRSAADDDSYSEVVYRFDGEGDLGPRQVIDHRFRTPGDKIYGVRLSAPESTPLDELREPVTTVVTSLCPTGATCVRG